MSGSCVKQHCDGTSVLVGSSVSVVAVVVITVDSTVVVDSASLVLSVDAEVVEPVTTSAVDSETVVVLPVLGHAGASLKHQPKPLDASLSQLQPSASSQSAALDSEPHVTAAPSSWHRNDDAMYSQRSLGHDSSSKKREHGSSSPLSWQKNWPLYHVHRSAGQSPSLKKELHGGGTPSSRHENSWLLYSQPSRALHATWSKKSLHCSGRQTYAL